jgi:hypothetical protein
VRGEVARMLPDYSETKQLFAQFFQTHMRRRAREISPFRMVQERLLHEGRAMHVTRADNTESRTAPVRMSALLEVKYDEVENLTLEMALQKYDEVVLDIVRQQASLVRERLGSEIPPEHSVDRKGRKLGPDILYEVMEKMQIEFYPDGRPHEIYIDGPLFASGLDAVFKEIDCSPELTKKFNDLMDRKREDWRAREAHRKLVG